MKKLVLIFMLLVSALCIFSCDVDENVSMKLSFAKYQYKDEEKYTPGGTEIESAVDALDIDWVNGGVKIEYYDGKTVSVSEKSKDTLTDSTSLQYYLEGTKLNIKFCMNGEEDYQKLDKQLLIKLPNATVLNTLELDGVSSTFDVVDINAVNIDVSSVSRDVNLSLSGEVAELNADTVSGKFTVSKLAYVKKFRCESVSGKISLNIDRAEDIDIDTVNGDLEMRFASSPRSIAVDAVAGSVTAYFPTDLNATLFFNNISGSFSSDISYQKNKNKILFSGAQNMYYIDTVSGSLSIKINEQ